MAARRARRPLGRFGRLALLTLTLACGASCASTGAPTPGLVAQSAVPETAVSLGYRLGLGTPGQDYAEETALPAGLFARYALGPTWALGLGIDFVESELEGPARSLGLSPAVPGTDEAVVESTQVSVWAERSLWRSGEHSFFGRGGVGFADVDVDRASGALAGGGSFDIVTRTDTELFGVVGVGYRYEVSLRWAVELSGQYELHDGSWRTRDRVSGAERTAGDYDFVTILMGIAYRF